LNESDIQSSYREVAPSATTDVVDCWWEQRIGGTIGGYRQRVIPDGCGDIIVSADGSAVLVGPTMRPASPVLAAGTHLRGLRIRTHAIKSAFGVPGPELRDLEVPLEDVLPSGRVSEVADAIWAGRRPAQLGPVLADARIRRLIGVLMADRPVSLAALAHEANMSERHLRRVVVEHSGLEPRAIRRLARMTRFLRLAEHEDAGCGLAELADRAGYADQSHLTRDIRDLTGSTPRELLRERGVRAEESGH